MVFQPFQPSVDSFGIYRWGCSWWHWRQANDTIAQMYFYRFRVLTTTVTLAVRMRAEDY